MSQEADITITEKLLMVNDLKERKQKKIKTAYFENKGLYGSPRLAVELLRTLLTKSLFVRIFWTGN